MEELSLDEPLPPLGASADELLPITVSFSLDWNDSQVPETPAFDLERAPPPLQDEVVGAANWVTRAGRPDCPIATASITIQLIQGTESLFGSLTQTWREADGPPSTQIRGTFPQRSAITMWLRELAEADGGDLQSIELDVEDDQAALRPRGWSAEGLDLTGTVTWE